MATENGPRKEPADGLVERLLRRKGGWVSNVTYKDGAGDLVNPDGPEAADVLASRDVELAELKMVIGEREAELEEVRGRAMTAAGAWYSMQTLLQRWVRDAENSQRPGGGDAVPTYVRDALSRHQPDGGGEK
jgi:hypothetical protein